MVLTDLKVLILAALTQLISSIYDAARTATGESAGMEELVPSKAAYSAHG